MKLDMDARAALYRAGRDVHDLLGNPFQDHEELTTEILEEEIQLTCEVWKQQIKDFNAYIYKLVALQIDMSRNPRS